MCARRSCKSREARSRRSTSRTHFYTARIDGGTKQVIELDLDKPGKYALLCFVSDRKGGPPHGAQGMIAEVTVR